MAGTFVLGDTILQSLTVYDQNDPPAPLTGVTSPAGITIYLTRQSGSAMIAASETVTFLEDGATGRYYFRFTPTNTGLYAVDYMVTHASANHEGARLEYSVLSAGSVFTPTYANCFCAESDIERRVQQSINATSTPSDAATMSFAQERAGVLKSLCARLGYPVTPTSITSGSHLEDMLRAANAIGAAKDWLLSQQTQTNGDDLPDAIAAWDEEWVRYVGGPIPGRVTEIVGLIEKEIKGNLVSFSTDHIISGDTMAPAATTVTSEPLGGPISMGSLF